MRALTFAMVMCCAVTASAQDRTLESNWAGSPDADLGADVSALDAQTPMLDDPSASVPLPTTPQPTDKPTPTAAPTPPAPPQQTQPTPPAAPTTPPTTEVPAGQWVYTQQYGWVYAPYAQAYTYVAPDAAVAQSYVWRVGIGWGWLLSPWIFSIGPRPYWGAYGPRYYAWHARPWFRPHVYPMGPRFSPYHRIGPGPFHARPHGGPFSPRRWR